MFLPPFLEKLTSFQLSQAFTSCITRLLEKIDNVTFPVVDVLFFYLINPQKSNYRSSYHLARAVIQTSQNLDVVTESVSCFIVFLSASLTSYLLICFLFLCFFAGLSHTSSPFQLQILYFQLLSRALMTSSMPKECEMVGSSLTKVYDVIIELYDIAPALVLPVIPQIGIFVQVCLKFRFKHINYRTRKKRPGWLQ